MYKFIDNRYKNSANKMYAQNLKNVQYLTHLPAIAVSALISGVAIILIIFDGDFFAPG